MINKSYVLFTRIAITKTKSGGIFCDSLWAKDLYLHLEYISNFSLCCPVIYSDDVDGLDEITNYEIRNIFSLNKDYGIFSVMVNLLPNLFGVIKACKKAELVHSGGAGWAFPLSFYLLMLKPFYGFKWIMIIESSFWLLTTNDKHTLRKLISHYVHKFILSRCVGVADVRIFTQSYYRSLFLNNKTERTLIAPATWVNSSDLVNRETIRSRALRRSTKKPLNLIFPARLEEYKGVFILFDAINLLRDAGVSVNISIMGTGALANQCENYALRDFGDVKLEYLEPVKYGKDFFTKLGEYDFVLVPNLKDEQPRIIFDAFSQGVPVIASNTTGILDITEKNKNAIIFKRNDAASLANAISNVAANVDIIPDMGEMGLCYATGKTHHQMHVERQQFINSVLAI